MGYGDCVKVFLTGATGFVGLNIVKALKQEGHKVVAYIRKSSNVDYLRPFEIDLKKGELSDLNALKAAMEKSDAVIHCAGNTSCDWRDLESLKAANFVSTKNIIAAAIAKSIKRVVYTSTTSTLGAPPDGFRAGDEKTALTGFRAQSPYGITKKAAEKELLTARSDGLEPVILNPAEILGPYDHNLQWGRIVLAIAANRLPFIPPGGASFCAAADVAKAHVTAIQKGRPGERYILAGHDVSFRQLFKIIGRIVGQDPVPQKSLPYPCLRIMCRIAEWLRPFTNKAPTVDSYRMKVFANTYYFSCRKANYELDYVSRSLQDMVSESFSWYQQNGFI